MAPSVAGVTTFICAKYVVDRTDRREYTGPIQELAAQVKDIGAAIHFAGGRIRACAIRHRGDQDYDFQGIDKMLEVGYDRLAKLHAPTKLPPKFANWIDLFRIDFMHAVGQTQTAVDRAVMTKKGHGRTEWQAAEASAIRAFGLAQAFEKRLLKQVS